MRGVDGWTPAEIAMLPRSVIELKFALFEAVSSLFSLQHGWWSCCGSRRCLLPLGRWSGPSVLPALSIGFGAACRHVGLCSMLAFWRCLWYPPPSALGPFGPLSATSLRKGSLRVGLSVALCLTLLIKCFNVLDRLFVDRLGFDPGVTRMWLAALCQLQRTVLVGGYSYSASGSTTGIPEGDPLSVVGMFAFKNFAFVFYRRILRAQPAVVTATYADNWECLAGSIAHLL